MNASSLETKTVRPGSLGAYSYYHSNRRPSGTSQPAYITSSHAKLLHGRLLMIMAIALVVTVGISLLVTNTPPAKKAQSSAPPTIGKSASVGTSKSAPIPPTASTKSTPAVAANDNPCASNTLDKLVVVSINQRHLWACQASKKVYDSADITGIDYLVADKTPTGTYHIYAKQTNTTLTGSDTTGNWSDPVSYWMPFLDNQYGSYGFHDATWRSADAFGKIDPNSSDASHGCVELPLATAKWLYNWTQVGTPVTIES